MSSQDSKYKYRMEIQQMMFVSGETNDPPVESTSLIEDIVRAQVVEILLQSSKTAAARNTKSIAPEDVIFLIRHDKAKVNRLRTYLSWKDVRKNAKDQETGNMEGAELIDDTLNSNLTDNTKMLSKYKKSKIRLPWELQFMFSEQHLETNDDEIDDDEKEATIASLRRLKTADDRTRNMTKEEYVHWSECRQASFTFRKAKRFREWCGVSHLTESRPQDDVVDILGFLTFEIVCSITEEALRIKHNEELVNKNNDLKNATALERSAKRRKHYLFDSPSESASPIMPRHIEEGWRRLQMVNFKNKAVRNFRGGNVRSRTRLI